jgi:hypothetical protein
MVSAPIFLLLAAVGLATPPYAPLSRPPAFSTATLGGMTFAHVTKDVAFNASDLDMLKKFSVVQFDKGQDAADMASSTLEDRFIHAARQIKAANPGSTTLSYLNGLINFPAFQRLYNATKADPSLLLHNTAGNRVDTLEKAPGTFDMRQEKMRKLFVSDALYAVDSHAFDGVFIDRANYASRAVLGLENGGTIQSRLENLGWDLPTARALVAGQTQLFAELTAALGPNRIVLAKETGGGTRFLDWKVANAAMTTDTFCSSYEPAPHPTRKPPASYTGNTSCDSWSTPVLGHVPLHGSTIWDGLNESTFAKCEESCCQKGDLCAAVLYNTEIHKCIHLPKPYTDQFICKNGLGVEWLANKASPGSKACGGSTAPPAPPWLPNATELWNASQCEMDMQTVVAASARSQLTESHGQGPLSDATQREFTMACFLIAHGNYSYFSYASWAHGGAWSLAGTRWWPEYDYPLGKAVDPPMMPAPSDSDGSNMRYRRRFESGTTVELDLVAHTAKISWAKQGLS